jgi:hypothetical protein
MMTCYPGPDVVPLDVAGYKWKVKEVNPYPGTSNTTDPKNITIKIIITED